MTDSIFPQTYPTLSNILANSLLLLFSGRSNKHCTQWSEAQLAVNSDFDIRGNVYSKIKSVNTSATQQNQICGLIVTKS